MIRSIRRAGTMAGLGATLVLGVVTSAHAAEPTVAPASFTHTQHAKDWSTAPAHCNTGLLERDWGSTCFNSTGDYQWARDRKADGYTVRAALQTSYDLFSTRGCIAGPASDNGGWCNWDIGDEDGCVRYWMILVDNNNGYQAQSDMSPWYSAKTGQEKAFSDCDQ